MAIAGLSGEENPGQYASLANNAAGTTGQLGSEYFQTDNRGFLDKLGSGFASGLGSDLGAVLSGKAAAPFGA